MSAGARAGGAGGEAGRSGGQRRRAFEHFQGVVADVVFAHFVADYGLGNDAFLQAFAQQPEEELLLLGARKGTLPFFRFQTFGDSNSNTRLIIAPCPAVRTCEGVKSSITALSLTRGMSGVGNM